MKSLKIWLLLLSIGFLQCGKSPDYSQGPTSSGGEVSIHLLSVLYQPNKGAVLIQWDQTGDAGKGNFHIQRKASGGDFAEIGQKTADGSDSDAGVFSFLDTEALAGELMSYRVVLRLEDKRTYPSNVLQTRMPGARLLDVRLDPKAATVQIRWWNPDVQQGVSYEVVRRIEEGSETVVYRTMDAGSKEFVDGPIVGDQVHSYWIRTLTQVGAKLESRSQQTGLYLTSYSTQFPIVPETSIRLAIGCIGSYTTTHPLLCVLGSGGVTMHRKEYYPPDRLRVPPGRPPTVDEASIYLNDGPALVPASISIAGASLPVLWNESRVIEIPRDGYTFVAGIDPHTQAVHINLFGTNMSGWTFKFRKPYPYLSEPPIWHVDPDGRTAITQEFVRRYDKYNHFRLYVVAGGTLKIFNIFAFGGRFPKAEIVEVWSEPIQATTQPYDLMAWENALWMSFPEEHRLVKAQIDFGSEEPQHITYRDIPLMGGIQPSALTVNFLNQVCVLDMHNSKIWMLNQDGDPITHIEVKGPGFMQDGRLNGDLVAGLEEGQDVLYVVKPSGILTILKTEMP